MGDRFRLSVHSYLRYIDVEYHLIGTIAEYGEYATRSSWADRVRLSVPGRRVHPGYGNEHANSRDAIGHRHKVAKDPKPTWMIEAAETSPLEILYDRVLQLEQEVSALKRNFPIGSPERQ